MNLSKHPFAFCTRRYCNMKADFESDYTRGRVVRYVLKFPDTYCQESIIVQKVSVKWCVLAFFLPRHVTGPLFASLIEN